MSMGMPNDIFGGGGGWFGGGGILRGPAGLGKSFGDGISMDALMDVTWLFVCDCAGASFRGIRSWVNRSASESIATPSTAPLTVFGRPCKACGFGCIVGLDPGAGEGLCGEDEYGGGGGMKSSSTVSEPLETSIGGIDSGRGLVMGPGRSLSLGSREEVCAGS